VNQGISRSLKKDSIMNRKNLIIVFLAFVIVCCFRSEAQNIQVNADINKKTIQIGDEVKLNLKVIAPSSAKIVWPVFQDTLPKGIAVLGKSKIDTLFSADKKQITLTQILSVTSYDSGFSVISPLRFIYGKTNDSTQLYAETNALLLEVKLPAVDTTKDIKDIKEPLKVPLTFKEIAPYIGLALLVAAIIYFGIYFYRKRKKAEPLFKSFKPKLPPHEIALRALEELRQKNLWQSNRVKEFHIELTEITRQYIEDRFDIRALEMTTDEIISALENIETNKEIITKLKLILMLADKVKFAKEQPLPLENEQSFNLALDYIKNTIVEIKTEENVQNA